MAPKLPSSARVPLMQAPMCPSGYLAQSGHDVAQPPLSGAISLTGCLPTAKLVSYEHQLVMRKLSQPENGSEYKGVGISPIDHAILKRNT